MSEQPCIKGNFSNIGEIPLDEPWNLYVLFRAWYAFQEAKFGNTGAQVMIIELKDIYYSANLTNKQRDVIRWHLVEQKTQQETAQEMDISTRSISRLVDQALDTMVMYASRNDEPSNVVPLAVAV